MAHGEISELMPAPSTVVFDVLHNYRRRLEWDTLLRAAYLEGDHACAGKGVTSVCVGRRALGGIALRTVYVTFQRPTLAAVKIINAPAFFGAWAASIHHEDLSAARRLYSIGSSATTIRCSGTTYAFTRAPR
jgi:hypothetical protein